jgi:hypothetical protein
MANRKPGEALNVFQAGLDIAKRMVSRHPDSAEWFALRDRLVEMKGKGMLEPDPITPLQKISHILYEKEMEAWKALQRWLP